MVTLVFVREVILTCVLGFQLTESEIAKARLILMASFSSSDMPLQDCTLSRDETTEAEIMAAVVFSVGLLVS